MASRRRVIAAILVVAALCVGLFMFIVLLNNDVPEPVSTGPVLTKQPVPEHKIVGSSVEGREIGAYTYGSGETRLVFIGGIHGGYEWNSVLLAYEFMDYFDANPGAISENLSVTVIPSANPDGVYKIIGKEGRFKIEDVLVNKSEAPGRFNAHKVDLNRNFDCKWKPKSMWREETVSGGTEPFSEPETKAIRDFVLENKPEAVIFWHSQSNAVYASKCEAGILPETTDIMKAYSRASGYPAVNSFDAYEITGDAEGWLASIGVPAITVELQTHKTIEWERNLAGVKALFEYYGPEKEKEGLAQ